jgi:beta-N-acetylhexosaminidase
MASGAEIRRRRRAALAVLAGAAAVAGAAVGSGGDGEPEEASAALPAQCAEPGSDGVRRAAGQMVMVRAGAEPGKALLRAAERGAIGGLIAFPPPDAPLARVRGAIERLQAAAADGGLPPLLVATDQEGGEVKRFFEGPPTLAPDEMSSEAEAERQGAETGRFLADLGINVDLAPVLDVPGSAGSFLGSRAFARDPATVARLGLAFARGLEGAGVAATAKHFPGLGAAPANTDFGESVVTAPRPALRAGLEPFEEAVAAEVPLVMVSHAAYPAFGAQGPASLDRGIIEGRLRDRLGFDGVTITDDLGAPAIAESPADAAVAAVKAGEDVLLYAKTAEPEAVEAIAAAVTAGRLDPGLVRGACARVAELKASLGA